MDQDLQALLDRLLNRAGLNRSQLAEAIGVHRSLPGQWGRRCRPSVQHLDATLLLLRATEGERADALHLAAREPVPPEGETGEAA